MAWVKYTASGRSYAPKATISTIGSLSFNEAACTQFGIKAGGYAVLYYDNAKQLIGIELVKEAKSEGARKLRARAKGVEISARPFLDHFSIRSAGTTSYPIAKDEKSGFVTISMGDGKTRKRRSTTK